MNISSVGHSIIAVAAGAAWQNHNISAFEMKLFGLFSS